MQADKYISTELTNYLQCPFTRVKLYGKLHMDGWKRVDGHSVLLISNYGLPTWNQGEISLSKNLIPYDIKPAPDWLRGSP